MFRLFKMKKHFGIKGPSRRIAPVLILCMLVAFNMIWTMRVGTLTLDERIENHSRMDKTGRNLTLQGLAMNLINEIQRLSNPSTCGNSTSTLYCGYPLGCGLGCQLHHHATCLMLSYSMRVPLIHDTTRWPFGKWEDAFQPLGSNCPTNERTIKFKWLRRYPGISFQDSNGKEFYDHFRSGIPVDEDLLQGIQNIHPDPFLWFVGQFLKYTMRLSSKLAPVVHDFLQELPRNPPTVGLHIRRTDKIKTKRGSYHDLKEYIAPAEAYFREVNCSVNCTVYLASDDHTLLNQARKLYPLPHWRFIGLNMNETFHNQKLRNNPQALVSIIKDVLALVECDYVICGFSSNICRRVLELINADHPDGRPRVKSLDFPYQFHPLASPFPPRLVSRGRQ